MEDPAAVSARLTKTAKAIVDEARVLAHDAITESADTDNYTAAQFITSVTKSADLALKAGLAFTRDLFDQPTTVPDPGAAGRRQVADVMETIGRRMVRQAGAVARLQVAGDQIDALIGPARYERRRVYSEDFTAPGTGTRKLRFAADGRLTRPGTADPVPADLSFFYTPDGDDVTRLYDDELSSAQATFVIAVDPRRLISGIYVGVVEATDAAGATFDVPVDIAI